MTSIGTFISVTFFLTSSSGDAASLVRVATNRGSTLKLSVSLGMLDVPVVSVCIAGDFKTVLDVERTPLVIVNGARSSVNSVLD